MTDTSLPASRPARGFFGSLFAALRSKRETVLTQKALYALSDRELDDIGITRGDIARVASKRF